MVLFLLVLFNLLFYNYFILSTLCQNLNLFPPSDFCAESVIFFNVWYNTSYVGGWDLGRKTFTTPSLRYSLGTKNIYSICHLTSQFAFYWVGWKAIILHTVIEYKTKLLILKKSPAHINLASILKKSYNPQSYVQYGITGCGVFKAGIQNWKGFCIKINCSQMKLLNFENWTNGEPQ